MWHSRLNAWMATVVTCLVERETLSGYLQKLYTDKCCRIVKLVIKNLAGNVRVFVECWAQDESVGRSNGKVTKAVSLPSNVEIAYQ